MLIKEASKLTSGTIISFPVSVTSKELGYTVTEDLDLVVIQAFSHHVLFQSIKYPHKKVDITNVDLYLHGIYKKADLQNYADPSNCLHGTQGGLKFFDKQI